MQGSMNATPFSFVFQNHQRNGINGFHAAPVFQHNYAITFNKTIFLIDQKIGRIIRSFFEDSLPKNVPLTRMGSEYLLELQPSRTLTSRIFESILEFYGKGALAAQVEEDMLDISQEYPFPLLYFYLNHKVQSSDEKLFTEDSFLSPFDKLEIAALQQNVPIFFQLLGDYCHRMGTFKEVERGLEKKPIGPMFAQEEKKKDELEAGFAPPSYLSLAEIDLKLQKEWEQLSRLMVHFKPKAFEKAACMIRHQSKQLYEEAIRAYVEAHSYCLDDVIHETKDELLKWDLIAYLPMDTRLMWFSQLKIEAPAEVVKRAIIYPLIAFGRQGEALEWAAKIQDVEMIEQISHQNKESARSSGVSGDAFAELESVCLESQQAQVKYRPLPLEFIRDQIRDQAIRFHEAKSDDAFKQAGKEFMEEISLRLQEQFNHGWTQELLIFARECYIGEIMARGTEQYAKLKRKTGIAISRHREQLHPALMEDLKIIRKSVTMARKGLEGLFDSEDSQRLLEKQINLLSENAVMDALTVCARRLFQNRFSLREDFIVQEVSNHFQRHFFNLADKRQFSSTEAFMQDLETRLEEAKLGGKMGPHEMRLAKETFIRKSIEFTNDPLCQI